MTDLGKWLTYLSLLKRMNIWPYKVRTQVKMFIISNINPYASEMHTIGLILMEMNKKLKLKKDCQTKKE